MVAKGCGQCLNFNCTFVMVAASALWRNYFHQISHVHHERRWCVQVLMLRRCLTWLRATWVVRVLPLDQNILLHQIVGYAILFYTLLHTSAHIFNFGTNPLRGDRCGSVLEDAEEMCACVSVRVAVQLSESSGFTLWEYLMTTRPGIGWVKGTASVTGVVLQVIICLMVLCSSTFVRRSGHFEVGF